MSYMKKSDPPIVFEATYNATIDALWQAITHVDEMNIWYFEQISEFVPEVGFETQFKLESETRTFTHIWKITEVIPKQKITYSWAYLEYNGVGKVSFELEAIDKDTKLTLTNEVIEDFPIDIPEFKRESCIAGWNYLLGQNLKEFIDKK